MGEREQFYIEDNHEPILSNEMFERAQEILRMRSSKHSTKHDSRKCSRKHSFSSKCTCGFCGGTYIRRIWHHGTDHEKPAWQCGNAIKNGRKECSHSKGVHESLLEEAFVSAYNKIQILNTTDIEEFLKNIEEALDVTQLREEVDGLTAHIRKLETKSQTLVEMRLEEKIAKEDYDKKYSAIEAELKDLRDQRNEKYEALQGEESISTRINHFRKAFDHDIQMDEFDRDILESLVDKVVVGAIDEEGNPNPYALTFVFKAGVKFTEEFYEKIANKSGKMEIENLSTYATDDKQLAYTYAPNYTR